MARALAQLPSLHSHQLDLCQELQQHLALQQHSTAEVWPFGGGGASPSAAAAALPPLTLGLAGSGKQQQPGASPAAPGGSASPAPAAGEPSPSAASTPAGTPGAAGEAGTPSTSASLYDMLFNRWGNTPAAAAAAAAAAAKSPAGELATPPPGAWQEQQQQQQQSAAPPPPPRHPALAVSPALAAGSPPLSRSPLTSPPFEAAPRSAGPSPASASAPIAIAARRGTSAQQQLVVELARSPTAPGMARPGTPGGPAFRRASTSPLVADQPLHQLLSLTLRSSNGNSFEAEAGGWRRGAAGSTACGGGGGAACQGPALRARLARCLPARHTSPA